MLYYRPNKLLDESIVSWEKIHFYVRALNLLREKKKTLS